MEGRREKEWKEGGYGGSGGIWPTNRCSVYEICQPFHPEHIGFLSHDKAYRVHEVGLARPIRPNHSHEGVKGADPLKSFIGFEIVNLNELKLDISELLRRSHPVNISLDGLMYDKT